MSVYSVQESGSVFSIRIWQCIQYKVLTVYSVQDSDSVFSARFWQCIQYKIMSVYSVQDSGSAFSTRFWQCIQYKSLALYSVQDSDSVNKFEDWMQFELWNYKKKIFKMFFFEARFIQFAVYLVQEPNSKIIQFGPRIC